MIRLWVRIRRGGPLAVSGLILMLLAAIGDGLDLAGYGFPVHVSESLRDALWRVAFAPLLLAVAIAVVDVVVAAVAQIRSGADQQVQVRPCTQLLLGLAMLLTTVALLTTPH